MKFGLLSSASALALTGMIAGFLPTAAQAGLTYDVVNHAWFESVAAAGSPLPTELTGVLVTLDQFDTSVLTAGQSLASISIHGFGSFTSSDSVHNRSGAPATFLLTVTSQLFSSLGTGAPGSFPLYTGLTLSNFNTTGSLNNGDTTVISVASGLVTSSTTTLTSGLGLYEGAGTFQISFSSITGYSVLGGGGNADIGLNVLETPGIYISYNLTTTTTSAPEPATLAVLGAALAGLGVVRRRRKA